MILSRNKFVSVSIKSKMAITSGYVLIYCRSSNGYTIIYSRNHHCDVHIQAFTNEDPELLHGLQWIKLKYSILKNQKWKYNCTWHEVSLRNQIQQCTIECPRVYGVWMLRVHILRGNKSTYAMIANTINLPF